MKSLPIQFDESIPAWEKAIYAFLAEKERRSGSARTVDSYTRTLQRFFGTLRKTPDQITPSEVFGFVHGIGPSGRKPAAVTVGARLACISSFYRFLMRMDIVPTNPCDRLERPRISPAPPRGLGAAEIRRLLDVIPQTPRGLRDRAIVLTLAITGRRKSEVLALTAANLLDDGAFYTYRGKGGKLGKRELPAPALHAIETSLAAWGKTLSSMSPSGSLWPSSAGGRGLSGGSFYSSLRKYLRLAGLAPAGVHILRHSAARLRREAGQSVEDVSQFLDHSSLGTTTVYLRRLEGTEDSGWRTVAHMLGVDAR